MFHTLLQIIFNNRQTYAQDAREWPKAGRAAAAARCAARAAAPTPAATRRAAPLNQGSHSLTSPGISRFRRHSRRWATSLLGHHLKIYI